MFAGEFVVLATDEASKCERGLDAELPRVRSVDLLPSTDRGRKIKRSLIDQENIFRFSGGPFITAHFTLTCSRKREDPEAAALQLTTLWKRPPLQACLRTSVADKLEATRAGLLGSVQPPQSFQ